MAEELRLPIRGNDLVFPDGKAICLVCGAAPYGTRTVWFETPREGVPHLGSKEHALATGVAAIASRVTFKAPLCKPHHGKAFRTGLIAVVFMLAALGVIASGAVFGPDGVHPRKKQKKELVGYVVIGLALIPGAFGYLFWKRKDRGGLPCEVRREGEVLVLQYPDRAPRGASQKE